MKQNRYKSYEGQGKGVHLKLPSGEALHILGDTDCGYTIWKKGEFRRKNHFNSLEMWCGESGSYFGKRKDAENFALTLAMYFNGDLTNKHLLDASFFNGHKKPNFEQSSQINQLFWINISKIDQTQGWDFFDFSQLGYLPDLYEVLPINDETFDPIDPRTEDFENFLFHCAQFIEGKMLKSDLKIPLHKLIQNCVDFDEYDQTVQCPEELKGYAALLIVKHFKDLIPFEWVFPGQKDYLSDLLPRVRQNLPDDIISFLKRMETEGIYLSI